MMLLDSVFTDLKKAIDTVVIKYETKARELDTIEYKKEADRYISAVKKEDSMLTYPTFSEEVLRMAGINDVVLLELYMKDKSLIPPLMQERVIEAQRTVVIRDYVEKNNYYRMLNGLPDIEDTEFVYITEDDGVSLGVDHTKPIHLFTEDELIKIEKSGIMDVILEANSKKLYLTHLRLAKVDIVKAREAKNFAILYTAPDVSEFFKDEFSTTYEQAREYFLTVIYNKTYGGRFDLYDNYIAMMIMVMTTQRLFTNKFKHAIERDFYDASSIKLLFDSYNVPYLDKLPLEHQRILARNLNNLIHYKSTDKVLFDICSLLGYERINIFKYYLIKEHNLDHLERPIFQYKEVMNESTGEIEVVEDTDAMYSLYFQTVEINERNVALALSNKSNRLDYNQVVLDDPFWQDDSRLKEKLFAEEFNYVESKYLGMNIMYKLTEMLFEIIYVFRMLTDKYKETDTLSITIPRLFGDRPVSFFKTVVLLSALISKKNGMVGNIIATPTKTLTIMGFDFTQDFVKIREEIKANPKLYDQTVLQYIQNMDIYSVRDINNLYQNVKNLEKFLVEAMAKTQSIDQYHAYKKLYQTLMTTDNVTTMFKKSNGDVASTFIDYLEDTDLLLADFVNNIDPELITETIDHILSRLNDSLKDLQHLYIFNDSNNVVMTAIITLIKFFKSYTTNLSSFNVLYLMDNRYSNMIRTISHISDMKSRLPLVTRDVQNMYEDYMMYLAMTTMKDKINPLHYKTNSFIASHNIKKMIPVSGINTKNFSSLMKFSQKNVNVNYLASVDIKDTLRQFLPITYKEATVSVLYPEDNYSASYKMKAASKIIEFKETKIQSQFNSFLSIASLNKLKDLTKIDDSYQMMNNVQLRDKYLGTSQLKIGQSRMTFNQHEDMFNVVSSINTVDTKKDITPMYDKLFIEWEK